MAHCDLCDALSDRMRECPTCGGVYCPVCANHGRGPYSEPVFGKCPHCFAKEEAAQELEQTKEDLISDRRKVEKSIGEWNHALKEFAWEADVRVAPVLWVICAVGFGAWLYFRAQVIVGVVWLAYTCFLVYGVLKARKIRREHVAWVKEVEGGLNEDREILSKIDSRLSDLR